MAHLGLEQLVEDPDQIITIPPVEIPRLIGDAEALKARLWARLQECSTSLTAAPPVPRGNSSDRLLTAAQAAERLDVTLARLYELVRSGTLPAVRIGRQIRFSPETLAQWIDDGGQALAGGWRREPNIVVDRPRRGTRP